MATEILSLVGILGVAVINVWGIKIQTKSKEKTDNIDLKITAIRKEFIGITNGFKKELNDFKEESKKADEQITKNMDIGKYYMLKTYLIDSLTKILNGVYIPNEEQKRILRENFEEYQKLGGNSYVADLFKKCVDKGLI